MTRPTTIHFAEVVQGQDFIMRVGTLYFPALMCNSLVFILYWREEHLVTQEGGMPGTEGEGGDTLGPRTLGHRMLILSRNVVCTRTCTCVWGTVWSSGL